MKVPPTIEKAAGVPTLLALDYRLKHLYLVAQCFEFNVGENAFYNFAFKGVYSCYRTKQGRGR